MVSKAVSDLNTLLTKCPDSTQFTSRNHEIDGCSTPPIIAIITPGLSVQDPVGGHCGVKDSSGNSYSTAFGQPEPPFPHGSSPIDLPCNKHDVCYQTCGSFQTVCDQTMYNDMIAVCNTAYPTDVCPYSGVDLGLCPCYLAERAECFLWASAYKVGLDIGGYDAWVQRQQQYCLCCP
ncbi:MAG: hypothetical protein HZA08_01765 [Nitrospirae bacterium]|nr:hypothetical protein [Nitrospirota bacterium]